MIVSESGDTVGLRHVPTLKWLGGIAITTGFGICACILLIRSNGQGFGWNWETFKSFVYVVFVGMSLMYVAQNILFAALRTVNISGGLKYVEIKSKRIYGNKVKRFHFHQINKFKSYKSKLNFSTKYFLAMVLANRKTVKLGVPIGDSKRETVRLVKKLNVILKNSQL